MSAPVFPPRGWQEPFIGVPFKDGGLDPAGWDCFGLVYWIRTAIFFDQGLDPHLAVRMPDAASRSSAERLDHQADTFAAGIAPGRGWRACERQTGAAVLLAVRGRPVHCGLVVRGTDFLHVDRKTPTCVESLADPKWTPRILGYYEPA